MARRRRDTRLQTVSDINVTPLMDLTFLLLIVFMITAPVLEFETDVSPPDMTTDAAVDADREPLMVSMNRQGTVLFQKQEVNLDELTEQLRFHRRSRADVSVLIRADGDRPYREVVAVMKAVRDANIRDISLVTQQEP